MEYAHHRVDTVLKALYTGDERCLLSVVAEWDERNPVPIHPNLDPLGKLVRVDYRRVCTRGYVLWDEVLSVPQVMLDAIPRENLHLGLFPEVVNGVVDLVETHGILQLGVVGILPERQNLRGWKGSERERVRVHHRVEPSRTAVEGLFSQGFQSASELGSENPVQSLTVLFVLGVHLERLGEYVRRLLVNTEGIQIVDNLIVGNVLHLDLLMCLWVDYRTLFEQDILFAQIVILTDNLHPAFIGTQPILDAG